MHTNTKYVLRINFEIYDYIMGYTVPDLGGEASRYSCLGRCWYKSALLNIRSILNISQ